MLKKLLNTKMLKNQKGLTLIELLAVIVILAIVAAIAIPAIGGVIENSRYNAVKSDAINVINAAQLYYTDVPDATTPVTVQTLLNEKYLDTAGKIPGDATVSTTVPRTITTGAFSYTSSKNVTFNAASIEIISADSQKGSSDGNKTVPKPAK